MRILTLFLVLLVVMSTALIGSSAQAGNIVAVVNEDVITKSDLNSRMKLIIVSSGMQDTADTRKKLRPQVIGGLIDEQLMFQEAERLAVEILDEEVEQGFAALAAQNKFEPTKFRQMVSESGIDILTMERQIEAQIAWTKVIQREIQPRLFVSENDVEDYVARMAGNKGKIEYLVSEIFLPVEDQKDDRKTLQLAKSVIKDVRKEEVPFSTIARQLSKAPGAENGGSLGWVQKEQLSEEIRGALSELDKGQIAEPVRSAEGYHVVLLRNKRTVSDRTMPSRDEVYDMLLMQRVERMQKRHLLDLKSAAFIEDRDQI